MGENLPAASAVRSHAAAGSTYRCVCGTPFEIHAAAGVTCPHCGRHYDPQVFANRVADTMTFSGDSGSTAATVPAAADPLIGTTRGHFRIVQRLGEGGMGSVYQAIDESLQRYVALKVIRPRDTATTSLFEQLQQEARAQARVNHPNVVHIYYVGRTDETPFFAMELMPGPTLADRLQQGPLPFGQVVRVGLQVASALDRAAQFDIVHGDIKPSNILEADPQTVKISDFGLSRRLSATDCGGGRMAGTPNYLAPECVRGAPADARSDIYALGVTLFELTFGRLPFQLSGATLRERLDAHLTQTPAFPQVWPAHLPEAWRDVLQRMLAKEPAERYAGYDELIADLKRLTPKRLILAPRVSRIIAWLLDASLVVFLQSITLGPALVLILLTQNYQTSLTAWIIGFLATGLASLLLAAALFVQCRWSSSPGKMLFQMAIVDAHGFRPRRRTLALRLMLQFPWMVIIISPLLTVAGWEAVDNIAGLIAGGIVLVNGAFLAIRRDQRAMHDVVLRTRVVIQSDEVG